MSEQNLKIPCDILLKNARYLDEDMRTVRNQNIVIRDHKIEAITDDASGYAPEKAVDGGGLLWMPGLIDGHTHTSQQFLRGRLLDEKPVIWKRINVPFESKLTEADSKLSAQVCALEMIKSGTTGFIDAGGKHPEVFADVYEQSGLRCNLTYITTDSKGTPDSMRVDPEPGLARLADLQKINGRGEGRIRAWFSVTSLMACSKELIHTVFSEAKRQGIPTEVHMNEYASEVFDFIERYGERPFLYLEEQGLLSDQFMASHCIYLSQEEIAVLQRNHVRVAHCPFSNCGKGIPPTPQLLHEGISVGFGTDGSAHGGLDLFKEMRLFRGVMNAHFGVQTGDPQSMPAETLLRMATQGGADAMMVERLGIIQPGMLADLIAVDIGQPHLYPTQNLVHSLVESAAGNDVKHMIVNGRMVMENRKILTLDEGAILEEVRRTGAGWLD